MKNVIAPTKNVAALHVAVEALVSRDHGVPGMGLVHGSTGLGKTTAVTRVINRTNAVFIRATSQWTPTAMLSKMMTELRAQPLQRRQAMLDFICGALQEGNRPLFVDEADYLLRDRAMLEALRDIHDAAGVPVVLIGMEGIAGKLVHHQQLRNRISHWVEFLPADLADARAVADATCEVTLDDELLQALHTAAKGCLRDMVVGLARIEALAHANGWASVSADRWADRPFFLGRD